MNSDHGNKTVSVDLAVIGSGVCGLCAALTAAEGGARVVVFEKQRAFGGTSNFFEGTFAVESDMQHRSYITYSRDEAFKAIMEYSHWRADPRLVRAIVNESGATISWLSQQGVDFSEVTINMPDAPRTYHVPRGRGAAVIKALVDRAKALNIELKAQCPVQRLQKEKGACYTLVYEAAGAQEQVRARAVMIASGGYANNRAWVKKYTGYTLDQDIIAAGNVDKKGDGIRMAWELGADQQGVDVIEMYRVGPMGPDYVMKGAAELLAAQPDLWINQQGERFCDEGIAFYETSVGNANGRHKEGYTYSLFDESIKQQVMEKGLVKGQGQDHPPGTTPHGFDEEAAAAVAKGSRDFFVADNLAGLADQIGIDPGVVAATVERYNGYCAKGHDETFAKNPRYLRPLVGPKYYAVKARTIFLGTLGGIKIDQRMAVIDKKGIPIVGLYAGGYDAGGMYGDSYSIKASSGLSSAFATNSGRIAGRSALAYLKQQDQRM